MDVTPDVPEEGLETWDDLPEEILILSTDEILTRARLVDPEVEEDGANQDLNSMRKGECAVIKTSTRQTVFLSLIDLVPVENLHLVT
jgi:26S proteasome regulatory subunit T5